MTTAGPDRSWVRRTEHVLAADPSRVVSTIFLPGQEMAAGGESRSTAVLVRVLSLSDADVDEALAAVIASYTHRHRDLAGTLESHFGLMEHRLAGSARLPLARRMLIGAYFTQ